MSDAQFSSLSPNSSNDLSNRYIEENDLNDQETLSIISNIDDKNVANLEDFDDFYEKFKIDPFLSDFMKEECDDTTYSKMPQFCDNLSGQNFLESNDMNCFYYSTTSENDLDEYLSVGADCLDEVSPDLLEWGDLPVGSGSLEQKSISNPNSNKRPCANQENCHVLEVPNKQRKIEISPQIRCHEWINKLNKSPENVSFKASGLLDRRKTKHHQILNDHDLDLYEDNSAHQNDQTPYLNKKPIPTSLSQISVKITSIKKPLSISIISNRDPHFRPITTTNRNPNRKPFSACKGSNSTEIPPTNTSTPTSTNSQFINSLNTTRPVPEIIDISRIPEPLRMGKRVSRRGQRFSLWQFLMCLLDSSRYKEHSTGIRWVHRNCGIFHIIDSKQVATLWGQYKERRDKMTYDSLARSLRHYYKKNLMAKINNRRLVYQIAQECLQWSSETFIKRNRD